MEDKGYVLKESNGIKYPFKARPYDDADYYYANSTDGTYWTIGYKGKRHSNINGQFEDVVNLLESLNKDIRPKMCHN